MPRIGPWHCISVVQMLEVPQKSAGKPLWATRAGLRPASLPFSAAQGRWQGMSHLQPRSILHSPAEEAFVILLDLLFQPPPFADLSLLGDVSQHSSWQSGHLQLISLFVCLFAFEREGEGLEFTGFAVGAGCICSAAPMLRAAQG